MGKCDNNEIGEMKNPGFKSQSYVVLTMRPLYIFILSPLLNCLSLVDIHSFTPAHIHSFTDLWSMQKSIITQSMPLTNSPIKIVLLSHHRAVMRIQWTLEICMHFKLT